MTGFWGLARELFASRRLRVRNHRAVVSAPVPPRVVSAFAALEMRRMLIACGCRDYSVRTPITESIPTTVCAGESKRVSVEPAKQRGVDPRLPELLKPALLRIRLQVFAAVGPDPIFRPRLWDSPGNSALVQKATGRRNTQCPLADLPNERSSGHDKCYCSRLNPQGECCFGGPENLSSGYTHYPRSEKSGCSARRAFGNIPNVAGALAPMTEN